ncbi:hypothetical protein [Crenobacter cavernae]|uniref:Uncharacterized protein n=1 Tax=Crenobacter cavernae TaxID=2290923 RepID=A0ABY0FFG6_9NEIS|nr:hypothetical protein [Crenobacter cavernae]RXZ43821.1 hypothetical protein EBB06_08060 [Crenobacter cavernae]
MSDFSVSASDREARDYRRAARAIVWLMRHAGVSPKRFLPHLTVTATKASLAEPGALLGREAAHSRHADKGIHHA